MRMNLSCSTCESMFMLKFPNANFSCEEWCFANDGSYGNMLFCSKTNSRLKSGARFEVGGLGGRS